MSSKINNLTAVTIPLGTDITNIVRSPFNPGDDHKILLSDLINLKSVLSTTPNGQVVLWPRVINDVDNFIITTLDDPNTASTIALAGVAGNVDNGTYTYAVTFVTLTGGETLIGPDSNSIIVVNNLVNGQVNVTNIPISTDPTVSQRNLYRNDGGGYLLVTTIADNTTTTYVDNLDSGSIPGSSPPTTNGTGRLLVDGDALFNAGMTLSTGPFTITGTPTTDIVLDPQNFNVVVPYMEFRPTSESHGIWVVPTGVGSDYTGDLILLNDRHSGGSAPMARFDEYANFLSADSSFTSALANIDIQSLHHGLSYGFKTAQGVKSSIGDYLEFGQASAGITAGNFQFGQDNAQLMRLNVPNGTGFTFSVQAVDIVSHRAVSPCTLSQQAGSAGIAASVLTATAGAHTAWTATNKWDVKFDLARTVQFGTGDLTEQDAFIITAPTYAFTAAHTIADAATFTITGAPIQGTNATLTRTQALWIQSGIGRFDGRIQGASANISSANNLVLGNANQNIVSGTTTINAISTGGWLKGAVVTLIFSGALTVKHNTAGGAGTAKIFLAGSTDLTTAANTVLGLEYDGTQWQETFRKVA